MYAGLVLTPLFGLALTGCRSITGLFQTTVAAALAAARDMAWSSCGVAPVSHTVGRHHKEN